MRDSEYYPQTAPGSQESKNSGRHFVCVPTYRGEAETDPDIGYYSPGADKLKFSAGSRYYTRADYTAVLDAILADANRRESFGSVVLRNIHSACETIKAFTCPVEHSNYKCPSFVVSDGKTNHDSDHYRCPCCDCLDARKAAGNPS